MSGAKAVNKPLRIGDLSIYHRMQGKGRPAVFLHGYASSRRMWQRVIDDYLSQYYTCYSLDLPGHGKSSKPAKSWYSLEHFTRIVQQFCYTVKLREILLIGHSLGGLISLNLALYAPKLVDKLILVNPAVDGKFLSYLDAVMKLERVIKQPIVEQVLRVCKDSMLSAVPAGLNTFAHPKMLFSESFRRCQDELADCTIESLWGCYKAIRSADISKQLSGMKQTALIIRGERDRVVPLRQSDIIVNQAPHAQLVSIPNAGHLPSDEQPAMFDKAVKQFLGL